MRIVARKSSRPVTSALPADTDCRFSVQAKTGATVYREVTHMYFEPLANLACCPPSDAACAGYPNPARA